MRLRTVLAPLVIPLAACALAVGSSGCSSSATALDPVAQAAATTTHAGGARMSMSADIQVPTGGALTLSGGGELNFSTHEGEATIALGGLPASAQATLHASTLQITELYKSAAVYVTSPVLAGRLPGGARWLKIDLARLGEALGLDPSSLTSGGSNPAQYLQELAASGGSKVVGHEAVRGVQTTRYAGTLNLLKAAEALPGTNVSRAREAFEKLSAEVGAQSMPVNVWVDGHGLVRKVAFAMSLKQAGRPASFRLEAEYFDFGPTPAVAAPAASEVLDITGQSLSALAGLGG